MRLSKGERMALYYREHPNPTQREIRETMKRKRQGDKFRGYLYMATKIYRMRKMEDKTLQEIADDLGVTRQRVFNIWKLLDPKKQKKDKRVCQRCILERRKKEDNQLYELGAVLSLSEINNEDVPLSPREERMYRNGFRDGVASGRLLK